MSIKQSYFWIISAMLSLPPTVYGHPGHIHVESVFLSVIVVAVFLLVSFLYLRYLTKRRQMKSYIDRQKIR